MKSLSLLTSEYLTYLNGRLKYLFIVKQNLRLFLDFLYCKQIKYPVQLNKKVILEYIAYVNETYGSSTRNRILSNVRRFLIYLVEYEYIEKDYSNLIKLKRPKTGLLIIPTIEEVEEFLDCVDMVTHIEKRDKSLLELLYSTAIRRKELINLNIEDVDIKNKTLRIIKGKGDKDRMVPIGDIALKYLIIYLTEARKEFPDNEKECAVYLLRDGGRITGSAIDIIFKKYNNKCNVRIRLRPHLLRHACATHLMQKGADIRYIQELLGHKSICTTEIYTHVLDADLHKTHNLYHPRKFLSS